MRECWAKCLGDCGGISREHLVSEGLWQGDGVKVVGFSWCKDEFRDVGPKALTAKILCTNHNSLLSPVDQAGIHAFDTLRRAAKMLTKRGRVRDRRWKEARFEVDGPLLERWFIKTAINLASVLGGDRIWSDGGKVSEPPAHLVEAAFGHATLAKPMGAYAAATLGEEVTFSDSVEFTPLLAGPAGLEHYSSFREYGSSSIQRIDLCPQYSIFLAVGTRPGARVASCITWPKQILR